MSGNKRHNEIEREEVEWEPLEVESWMERHPSLSIFLMVGGAALMAVSTAQVLGFHPFS